MESQYNPHYTSKALIKGFTCVLGNFLALRARHSGVFLRHTWVKPCKAAAFPGAVNPLWTENEVFKRI
jgi:hypothetical protein